MKGEVIRSKDDLPRKVNKSISPMRTLAGTLKRFCYSMLSIPLYLACLASKARADDNLIYSDTPPRLRDFEWIFGNIVIAIWALSIPFFIFMVLSIGFQYMFSFGDENKTAAIKQKGTRLVVSMVLLFGGYIVIRLVMSLLVFKDPGDCFKTNLSDSPMFKFFFPGVCTGTP